MKNKKGFGLVLLISLLIIVIILYAFITSVASKKDNNDPDKESTEIVFIDKQASEVTSVTYRTDGSEFTVNKSGSTYVLDGDDNFPLDMNAVNFMVNAAAKISFQRRIDPEGNDLEEYGLVDPRTEITAIYKDGARLEMKLGNYNVYSESYYCTVGDGFVYLIDSDFALAFDYEFTDLLLDDSVKTPQNGFSSVTDIEITEGGKTVTLSMNDDGIWIKTDSDGKIAEGDFSSTAYHIYSELYLLQVDEWVTYNASDDAIRDAYGLKTPEIRVLFRHTETKTVENEGSSSVTKEYERTTAFLIGNTVNDDGPDEAERYFMFGDGSVVYVLSESTFSHTMNNRP